MSPEIYKE
jgi:serine/threonine protein kinase